MNFDPERNRQRNYLRQLQQDSAVLEPRQTERKSKLKSVGTHIEAYLQSLGSRSAYEAPEDRQAALDALAIAETGCELDSTLDLLDQHVHGIGQNLKSGGFFGYIPSGGLYDSALADYIAAASNPYSGVGHASPGASRMENALLDWLRTTVGYPETATGDLTSGGSMAALSAVIAAREAHGIHAERVPASVVYATAHTHHTFFKALHIAGLGGCSVRTVAVDASHRMDADALQQCIEDDLANGYSPWLIAATAGTTDTGTVDPLNAIADIAKQFQLWMHVDAAYGGAFILTEQGRLRLDGLQRSDSMILDPHKGFFLPCGTGVLLVKDGRKLYDAYHSRGAYMQDVEDDTERSPCDYSAELTRPFRALRFWLPFKLHGSKPFAAALEEKLLLARYFYEQIQSIPGIETGPEPDLSIVTFRCIKDTGNANDSNRQLLDMINQDGRVRLTSTMIDGKFTIRMAILNYRSHLEDVELVLEKIRKSIATVP